MNLGVLGRDYSDEEVICRQGELGDRMYVIQSGKARVLRQEGDSKVIVGDLEAGDLFGEMAIFEKEPRSATVLSVGTSRVLTLDKRAFLRRAHEDPSLMFNLLRRMSQRIRSLDQELAHLKASRST